jgi:hypothetical protein
MWLGSRTNGAVKHLATEATLDRIVLDALGAVRALLHLNLPSAGQARPIDARLTGS